MITIDEVLELSIRLLQRAGAAETRVRELEQELAKCQASSSPPKE